MVQPVWGAEADKAPNPPGRAGGTSRQEPPLAPWERKRASGGTGRFIFLLSFPQAGSSSGAREGRRGDGGSGVKPKKVIIILKYSLRIP